MTTGSGLNTLTVSVPFQQQPQQQLEKQDILGMQSSSQAIQVQIVLFVHFRFFGSVALT